MSKVSIAAATALLIASMAPVGAHAQSGGYLERSDSCPRNRSIPRRGCPRMPEVPPRNPEASQRLFIRAPRTPRTHRRHVPTTTRAFRTFSLDRGADVLATRERGGAG